MITSDDGNYTDNRPFFVYIYESHNLLVVHNR